MTTKRILWGPFLAAVVAVGTGCGGTYRTAHPTSPAAPAAATKKPAEKKQVTIAVEAAGMPFAIVRGHDGHAVTVNDFYADLMTARAVCIGEEHSNPHAHWAQLQVLDQISQRAQAANEQMAVGMEMFQRPFQGVLDDYVAGRIDEAAMLARTGWKERWGFDYALYRPLIRMAVERKAQLLALNVLTELKKKFSKKGIDGLTPEDRAKIPELDLDDAQHRAWWDSQMMDHPGGDHGHGHGHDGPSSEEKAMFDRMYKVQVLWDETMADTAARWLKGGDDRMIVILAGDGHCHDSAIVKRLARRGVGKVLSVHPVIDTGDGEVSDLLADPQNDYLFVMTPPTSADAGAEHHE